MQLTPSSWTHLLFRASKAEGRSLGFFFSRLVSRLLHSLVSYDHSLPLKLGYSAIMFYIIYPSLNPLKGGFFMSIM